MSRALQIYYTAFDAVFLPLPDNVRHRIQAAIDDLGLHLSTYPHFRLPPRQSSSLLAASSGRTGRMYHLCIFVQSLAASYLLR